MAVLVPETAGRLDQHDRHIQALAETRNWKQVLTQIDKRLKKGKNPRLLINKALIQIRMPDRNARQLGFDLLRTTLATIAPVLDDDILEAVDDTANSQVHVDGLRELASSMWEATLKAQPNNEELLLTVFEHKIAVGDWDAARKFCMTKMKTDRDWFLRWIVCVHLVAVSKRSKAPDLMKKMNAGLATKSLAKALSDAVNSLKTDPAQPHGPHSNLMRSFQEVDLLVEIHRKHGMYAEIAQMLNTVEESGLSTYTGGRFAHTKDKIEALTLSKNWQALLNLSKNMLQDARSSGSKNSSLTTSADDWAVWNAYVTALSEAYRQEPEELRDAVKLLHYYTNKRKSLNAGLACITLFLRIPDAAKELKTSTLDLYSTYIKENGHKLFAFNQLKQSHLLPPLEKKGFLKLWQTQADARANKIGGSMANAKEWLTTEINSLKLDYYHVISENSASETREKMLYEFTANCWRLYKLALKIESDESGLRKGETKEIEGPTERFVGDDAGVLAAMSLIHLWFAGADSALLRCAYILESVLSRSKHNYDAIMLAVRVHLYMGQFARAAYFYKQLDTKNLQNLSVAWIVTPRLSSFHPHRSKLWRDGPEAFLQAGNRWIMSSQGALRRAYNETLRHGSYRNFLHSVESFELSHQSVPALTFSTELDRSVWSQGGTASAFFQDVDVEALKTQNDPREMGSFPCYEHHEGSSLETALRPGPLPQAGWTEYRLRSRYLRFLLLGAQLRAGDAAAISSLFERDSTEPASSDSTGPEMAEDMLVLSAYKSLTVLLSNADKPKSAPAELKTAMKEIMQACNSRAVWLTSAAKEQVDALNLSKEDWQISLRWDTFHWIHQQLYINDILAGYLRFIRLAIDMWGTDTGLPKSAWVQAMKELEQVTSGFRDTVRKWATSLQIELRQPETIQQMVSALNKSSGASEPGAELGTGPTDSREFVINIANGWADSLEAFNALRKT